MREMILRRVGTGVAVLILCTLVGSVVLAAQEESDPFAHLEFRNIGPVNMSGRVADVEGVAGNPKLVYVGAASGGVWKTEDGGLTFDPIFDDQPIASIGDIGVAASNPEVLYVGSGEANARNSVSFGNGVYKSTDGGQSWRHLGLEGSRHISRVIVDPTDPDTVFVAAMGSFFGPSETRGVYRSQDGGATWEQVLYLDDQHGASDLDMDPTNPNILYAALWRFDRKPWTHTSGSEEGGVWRSVDGGDTWTKLEEGLPKLMGRIGVKVAPSRPQTVYVIAESNNGVLFRSDNRGDEFEQVSDDVSIVSRGLYYTDMRVDPWDENRLYAVSSRLFRSIDGGHSFQRIARSVHVDFHAMWIDPTDPSRMWIGEDGGVAVTYDRGESWEPIRNLPIAQFYQAFHDTREPFYYLGGGLQDNGTWYGPSRTREPAGILPDDWRMMSFGDAYFVVPHPEQVDLFLSKYQGGGIMRTDMTTRQQVDVNPQPRRNDGGPVGELEYRFSWNAPIVASPHDPETVYFAGNVVFKTHDFGDNWTRISPDLTTDDDEKQGEAGGPVWYENTTAEYHCTIISFAESPVEAGVLWAGTDDGNLQLSRDGGASWSNVVDNIRGVPAFSSVSHVEPSRAGGGVAYASFDRHMFDDFRPHIYRTDDYGASWRRVTAGLPEEAWVWVVREDPTSTDVLWAGTELGLFASHDGGTSWQRMHAGNLPTVAVHDVLIQPQANDLILATHGRALWVFDDATPLQQFPIAEQAGGAHLFPIREALRFPTLFTRYGLGDKSHRAPNPPAGALISYYLPESLEEPEAGEEAESEEEPTADGDNDLAAAPETAEEEEEPNARLTLEILDDHGELVRTLEELGQEQGINRVAWNLAFDVPKQRQEEDGEYNEFRQPPRGPYVLPGSYTARLTLDGTVFDTEVVVRLDPTVDASTDALQTQQDAAAELTRMISAVNTALRGLDSIRAQLDSRRSTAEALEIELPKELEESWEALDETLEELLGVMARADDKPFWSQGPRLIERLGDLFSGIDSQFTAPTAAQLSFLAEIRDETVNGLSAFNGFLTTRLAALNTGLADSGLPTVATPKAVTLDELD